MLPRPPPSPLFPYTTLFRSSERTDPFAHVPRPSRGPGWQRATRTTYNPEPQRIVEVRVARCQPGRSEEHTSELQSRPHLVCRLLLEKKKKKTPTVTGSISFL